MHIKRRGGGGLGVYTQVWSYWYADGHFRGCQETRCCIRASRALFPPIIAGYRPASTNGGVMCYSAVSVSLLLLQLNHFQKRKKKHCSFLYSCQLQGLFFWLQSNWLNSSPLVGPREVTSLALWMPDDHQAELNVWM